MQVIMREVDTSFEAFMMCKAILDLGGQPYSVVFGNDHGRSMIGDPIDKWYVFGLIKDGENMPDEVDDLFTEIMGWGPR